MELGTYVILKSFIFNSVMNYRRKKRLSVDAYVDGIIAGDRLILSRAVTLVESKLKEDTAIAEQILEKILPQTGQSIRIGITGVPGVGKSTFIESFGKHITTLNKKLAVLTIDPSSQRSKGSILGDKTRMEELARDPLAYIRPSPTSSALGGVGNKTRETMLLCEAAGYEVIFVETVGVGQSETAVHGMVDFFLLLMLAGAGDELQGIKKGIMEMADSIAITKADGENTKNATKASIEYQNALHLFPRSESGWIPKVTTCSALENKGINGIWKIIQKHHELLNSKGLFLRNRQQQNLSWMHEIIRYYLESRFYQNEHVKMNLLAMEEDVTHGKIAAINAAKKLLEGY